ncbi:MAG: hypothetical protein JW709_07965 [Sedimentisphaerales bacterium]|nr:hypothetical protein [Sedimentisphaerales bacterium]
MILSSFYLAYRYDICIEQTLFADIAIETKPSNNTNVHEIAMRMNTLPDR